ncbi:S9 family peptidase [Flavobacterium sp. J27]|uniref:alpha/beta hydrolase family protein n=1 Tax=Flavobacterium sp. J27 TaxID=2060419 RepID=UPI0010326BF7|nr:alpha/beta hydrolase [Flavobacterium sp. J27]
MKQIAFFAVLSFLVLSCSKDSENQTDTKTTSSSYLINTLQGPIAKPTTGYGSDGNYTVASVSFPSPTYTGKNVTIFYPQGITTPKPTIFYSHPYGGEESEYNIGLYRFIAKKGYVVVFAPYPTSGTNVTVESRYDTLWQSFITAAANYPDIIDTTKVGFMGHSFGGGASFYLSQRAFSEKNWGENGRFLFVMAQWYSYFINTQSIDFPSNTKLITQVYDDDVTNDHRMAIDMFKNNNILNSEKDFILIKKSVLPNYTYTAEHNLPNTQSAYDAYDYYGIYRLLDALIDYSFNGNLVGKNVALGNGSAAQVTMPSYNGQALEPLIVTDNPTPLYPQSKYSFKCYSLANNPRYTFCN